MAGLARPRRAHPVRRVLLIQTAKDWRHAVRHAGGCRAAPLSAELTVLHDPITSRIIAQQPGLRRLAQPARAFAAWPAVARCCACCAMANTTPC